MFHAVTKHILSFANRSVTRLLSSLVIENAPKPRATGHAIKGFVNMKRVLVEAGNGGDGCIAFERLFCNPKAGPSGGDGGNGGHVVLQASSLVHDLSQIPSIIRGEHGVNGKPSGCHGASGQHTYIQVPIGTCIYNVDKEMQTSNPGTSLEAIGKLTEENAIFVVARGGAGGKGNVFLTNAAKLSHPSNTGRNPPLRIAERGARGQQRRLLLRMSRLAEIGLVGMPNAGKSTLLRRLTRARPKVAPYAFTTLQPQMGVLQMPCTADSDHVEMNRITVADLPGLLAGAAKENKGLGAHFLSLIADCRLLAFVIDIGTPWLVSPSQHGLQESIRDQLCTLRDELCSFDETLLHPHRCLVIGTKMDLVDVDANSWNSTITDWVAQVAVELAILHPDSADHVVLVSAQRGDNVDKLIECIKRFSQMNNV